MEEISQVMERTIKDLNFKLSEKIRLSVFPDKVIRKAKDIFERTDAKKSNITDAFSRYYAMCLHESERLKLPADFNKAQRLLKNYACKYNVDVQKSDIKKEENVQKSKITYDDLEENPFHPKHNVPKKRNTSSFLAKQDHITFNEGERYFKHGKWHQYPDQAIEEDSVPCKPKYCSDACGACKTNKPINRTDIEPKHELLKAIASGNVNMQGLSFLRNCSLQKPDVLEIIDKAFADAKANAIDVAEFSQDAPKINKEESNDTMPGVDMEKQKTLLREDCRPIGNFAMLL